MCPLTSLLDTGSLTLLIPQLVEYDSASVREWKGIGQEFSYEYDVQVKAILCKPKKID